MATGANAGTESRFSTLATAYVPPSTAKSFVIRDTPVLMQSTASAAIYQAMP